MVRRREKSSFNEAFEPLRFAPIWIGPVLVVFVLCFIWFVIPLFFPRSDGRSDVWMVLRVILPPLAWLAAATVMVGWIAAEIWKLANRRLLNRQNGILSIRQLPWRQFERLVAEAYRRKGYVAEVVGNDCGDGGVDVRLTGRQETTLVQCKQWRAYTVGVRTVRELLGIVTAQGATRGIVVTSGRFTDAARRFAADCGRIELVDGPALAELVHQVQGAEAPPQQPPVQPPVPLPRCPCCGSAMVLRTARRGTHNGTQFWGCTHYPDCRGTQPHEACVRTLPSTTIA